MVTVTKNGEGKCVWCCQETDGVHAKFQDGLQGFFCWRDFRAAVKARSEERKEDHRASHPAGSGAA